MVVDKMIFGICFKVIWNKESGRETYIFVRTSNVIMAREGSVEGYYTFFFLLWIFEVLHN